MGYSDRTVTERNMAGAQREHASLELQRLADAEYLRDARRLPVAEDDSV